MLKNRDAFNSCILTIKVHQVGAQAHFLMILGSILGSLGAPFGGQLGSFFQVWFQGGSQGGFWVHSGMLLEVILKELLSLLGAFGEFIWNMLGTFPLSFWGRPQAHKSNPVCVARPS